MASIKWQYQEELAPQTESKYKRDRLFFGLHKDIKDSVRQTYKDPKVSYVELLRAAREPGSSQASTQQPATNRGGQHDQPQGVTGGGFGQTRTPRQPFCFYCKNQGSDQYNHWPNRCELLGSVISGYHQEQAKTGHTDNKGNTSEHS